MRVIVHVLHTWHVYQCCVLINAHLISLGESAVGKSSLVLRFVKGQFHEYQESTIGGKCVGLLTLDVYH